MLLEKRIRGFDQNALDEFYAEYDDPQESLVYFSEDAFMAERADVKGYLLELEWTNNAITRFAKTFVSFYTLWSVVALERSHMPPAPQVAERYQDFMQKVERLNEEKILTPSSGLRMHKGSRTPGYILPTSEGPTRSGASSAAV